MTLTAGKALRCGSSPRCRAIMLSGHYTFQTLMIDKIRGKASAASRSTKRFGAHQAQRILFTTMILYRTASSSGLYELQRFRLFRRRRT